MSEKFTISQAGSPYVVRTADAVIGETTRALVLSEVGYDPVVYIPREDIGMELLERSDRRTKCPHKGEASYYHIVGPAGRIDDAAWSYEDPIEGAGEIAGHLAFHGEKVT